jgi:SAM-dependent methyltransferase
MSLLNEQPSSAVELAQNHWNATPLFYSDIERYRIYPWLYDAAEFDKHRDEHVLEVGCGTGCDLLQFAKNGAIATGVDITERHVALARERVAGMAEVIHANATCLPFSDGTFDYVYSHGVIHHSDDPRLFAKEVLRVLRPGGRLNIHAYALCSFATMDYVRLYGKNWKRHVENSTDPVHLDLYTARRMRELFPDVALEFRKREIHRYFKPVERWLGWFLIATGEKNW